jgi:putative inorganic carbon (HCO3(-)) transporter
LREGGDDLATLSGRFPVWWAAVQMFVQHPAFGVGLQNFGAFVRWYNPALHVNHAHNIFLNMAAERGALGLVTFGAVLIVLFRTLVGALKKASGFSDRLLAAGFIASFAGFLVHSSFDVSYYDYRIELLFWLLVGVAACLPRLLAAQRTAVAVRRQSRSA